METRNTQLPFILLTLVLMLGLILPSLVQDGMFMDGQQYACVAKNYAHGKGSFWFPFLSKTWYMSGSPNFMEQPPLVYWLQSIFFQVLGDSMYTERIYSLIIAMLTAWLIMQSWKLIPFEDVNIRELSWLPVLFWIIIPTTYWSFNNNMLENTMGLFTALAVYFILRSISSTGKGYVFILLAGISVFLASMCKGLPGLFPLGFLFFYSLLFPKQLNIKKAITRTLLLIAIPAIAYSLLMLDKEAHDSIIFYITKRLLYRVNNNPTVSNRFYIIGGILQEMILPAILCVIILFTFRKNQRIKNQNNKLAIFFLLIAASASLPLLLTPVQKKFYMFASFEFYGMAFAVFIAPFVEPFIENNSTGVRKRLGIIAVCSIGIILVVSACFIGKASRDKNTLHDVYLAGSIIPKESIIDIEESMKDNWSLQFYLLRYYDISCRAEDSSSNFIMTPKEAVPYHNSFEKIPLHTLEYDLYRKSR